MSSIPFAAKNFSVDRRQYGDAFWRSLFYFNVYRLGAALVLLAAILALGSEVPFGSNSRQAYLYSNVCYIVFSVMAFVLCCRADRISPGSSLCRYAPTSCF